MYNSGTDFTNALKELDTHLKDKRTFVAVLMDEAHHSYTRNEDLDEEQEDEAKKPQAKSRQSAHFEILSKLKAHDQTRKDLIVLCVTATPFNRMTTNKM